MLYCKHKTFTNNSKLYYVIYIESNVLHTRTKELNKREEDTRCSMSITSYLLPFSPIMHCLVPTTSDLSIFAIRGFSVVHTWVLLIHCYLPKR